MSIENRLIQHLRSVSKNTTSYACIYCEDYQIFHDAPRLWEHALSKHKDKLPEDGDERQQFRKTYEIDSASKRPVPDGYQRKHTTIRATEPAPKRPFEVAQSPHSLSGLGVGDLSLGAKEDAMAIDSVEASVGSFPRKRAHVGDGISTSSRSPFHDSSTSPPLRSSPEAELRRQQSGEISRPPVNKKHLWIPDSDSPYQRSSIDLSNMSPNQLAGPRAQGFQGKLRKPLNSPPKSSTIRSHIIRSPKAAKAAGWPNSQPSTPSILANRDEEHLLPQPETRPISQSQLIAEVKGIYAGLVMIEAKCIEVDKKYSKPGQAELANPPKLNNEQLQATTALHRTLLFEHHDFFLASQHPSASAALRRLASKYAMPARMWRHGIHSYLELLRHRLPASRDHMVSFIYLSYTMVGLLFETVPNFEDTWKECLGDLGRYRMAIEDDDIRDREVWNSVSTYWYSKASDKAPTTGRLYHHQGILARPDALKQLFFYSKSLCVANPFLSARESILTVLGPALSDDAQTHYKLPLFEHSFVKLHAMIFTGRDLDQFEPTVAQFTELLDNQIGKVTSKFLIQGYQIAIANCVSLLSYGDKNCLLKEALSSDTLEPENQTETQEMPSMQSFKSARLLHHQTAKVIFSRIGDPSVLSYIIVELMFLQKVYESSSQAAIAFIDVDYPWTELTVFLNTLSAHYSLDRLQESTFLVPEQGDRRPFPEDWGIRGLPFANYPDEWFECPEVDEEEKDRDMPSMFIQRRERALWSGHQIAKHQTWMTFDEKKKLFVTEIDPLK